MSKQLSRFPPRALGWEHEHSAREAASTPETARERASEETFSRFYAAEYPTVLRAVLAFSANRELAYDATQEAFVRAFSRWSRLCVQPWAGAWVMTTALNVCRRHLRRRTLRGLKAQTHVLDLPQTDRIEIIDALQRLPLRQREAILLFYLGDLPVGVVAQFMNLSEGTVKAHLSRGRNALREQLDGN